MIEYSYNYRDLILEVNVTGTLTIETIISHYERITNDVSLPRILRVLIDAKSAKFDIKMDDIKSTTDGVTKALQRYIYISEAILVDKPYATAVALLFNNNNGGLDSYDFQVFNTENAARKWLI